MSNPFYTAGGLPAAQSRGASTPIRNEYAAIAAGFDGVQTALAAKLSAGSNTFTGVQDFTGGTVRVATPVGITDAVTKQYVDGLAGITFPGQSGNAGKFAMTNGATIIFASIDSRGYTFIDKGNSGTATQTLDYSAAETQRITATGAFTLATTGWPAGRQAEMLVELVNGAAFTITWPTINWIKSDGTQTTTFSANGVTLQASGTDFVLLWTRNGGATIYGKVVR